MFAIMTVLSELAIRAMVWFVATCRWLIEMFVEVAVDTVIDPLARDPANSGPFGTIRPHGVAQILIGGLLAMIAAFAPPILDVLWHHVVGVVVSYRALVAASFLGGCLFQGIRIYRQRGYPVRVVKP